MAKVIVITNQKGGTGKTTTVLHLGAALAKFHRQRVILIDMDPQGSLTLFSGHLPENLPYHLGRVLREPKTLAKSLLPFGEPPLSILPCRPNLEEEFGGSGTEESMESRLTVLVRQCRANADVVIIDTPPTLGSLTRGALRFADSVLIPLQCEFMALRGLQLLLKTVAEMNHRCSNAPRIFGVLPTMFDTRTLHAREVLAEIRTALADRVPVCNTVIPHSVRFAELAVAPTTLFDYQPNHPGALAYRNLAKEVMVHG